VNTPIFSQTTERIWKRLGPLKSLSSTLSNSTRFTYPDLVEDVNFDKVSPKRVWRLSEKYCTFRQSTWIRTNGEKYWISHSLMQQIGILVIYSFYGHLMKKYEIDHRRSITGAYLRNWGTRHSHKKGDKKRLGFLFGYILITTAPITMMLTATERGKDWIFLGIGVTIYKMERFYRKV